MTAQKLDAGQKHLLSLITKGADAEGWANVSKAVYPLFDKSVPKELVILEPMGNEGRGRARLTEEGANLLAAMAWL